MGDVRDWLESYIQIADESILDEIYQDIKDRFVTDKEIEALREYLASLKTRHVAQVEIPYKFPSLNEYVNECRKNKFAGAKMKKQIQEDISWFITRLPVFDNPVIINFTWVEGNKRRDLDNIAFAKKFILDTLVDWGKLRDDNRKIVTAFRDNFAYGDDWKVILDIEEVEDGI